MENFYEYLEKIESVGSTITKEVELMDMIKEFPEAEKFLRFAYNDTVYGIGEKTFYAAFPDVKRTIDCEHVSDYLFDQIKHESTKEGYEYQLHDLYRLGERLKIESGDMQINTISNIFRQLTKLEKKWWCRALLHDLRCGVKVKTVNNVFKSLSIKKIEKFAMQLCGRLNVYDEELVKKRLLFPCSMECKYDGIRIQAEMFPEDNGEMTCILTSRRGKDRTDKHPEICEELCKVFYGQHVILDGEIIAGSFQKLTRKDDTSKRIFRVWDILNDEKLPYINRWDNLRNLMSSVESNIILLAEHFSCNNITELQEYYEELVERGEEGLIVKLDNTVYKRNNRKNMYKCKPQKDADLKIIGYKFGEGKRAGKVATLELIDASGTIKVDVGSGINDEMSSILTEQVNECDENYADPEFIGKIIEIHYFTKTETGSLQFPRLPKKKGMQAIREDKEVPDDLS